MLKNNLRIAVLVLATALSGAAFATRGGGGGGHFGGGRGAGWHFGGRHFGGEHGGGIHLDPGGTHFWRVFFGGTHAVHFGRPHGWRGHFARSARYQAFARPRFSGNLAFASRNRRSGPARNAMNSRSFARGLGSRGVVRDPNARVRIAAVAATAGWHGGRSGAGWLRHGNGGFGWVGPLFWPFAYHDIYDYATWGAPYDSFWDYGYNDIYAGLFAYYGYDDLAGYSLNRVLRSGRTVDAMNRLQLMCGEDDRDIVGLPIDQIQEAIQPIDAQLALPDELANASVTAARTIRAACPTSITLTAPNRLAFMQQRIEAMVKAVSTVQPALDKFYGQRDDEQKAPLNALAEDQRKRTSARNGNKSLVHGCGVAQGAAMEWPTAKIEARLHPTEAQRASLTSLQNASAEATDMLKTSCQPDDALAPPARLAAVGKRLDTMLQAVKIVRTALDDFYATLSDEQKARFEAIGLRRTARSS